MLSPGRALEWLECTRAFISVGHVHRSWWSSWKDKSSLLALTSAALYQQSGKPKVQLHQITPWHHGIIIMFKLVGGFRFQFSQMKSPKIRAFYSLAKASQDDLVYHICSMKRCIPNGCTWTKCIQIELTRTMSLSSLKFNFQLRSSKARALELARVSLSGALRDDLLIFRGCYGAKTLRWWCWALAWWGFEGVSLRIWE